MDHLIQQSNKDTDELLRKCIQHAAAAVTCPGDEDVFKHLVKHIAEALELDYAYMGVLVEDAAEEMIEIIAMYSDGQHLDSELYPLKGTPCENVVGKTYRYYPDNINGLFENDLMLKELSVRGYAGIPLYSSTGQVMGLMAVMNRKRLSDEKLTKELMQIFSVRAALELERRQSKQVAEESSEQYEAIFNASTDGLLLFDGQGQVIDVNPAWRVMHNCDPDTPMNELNIADFTLDENKNLCHELIEHINKDKPFHTQTEVRRLDNTYYTADITGIRMLYKGRPHLLAIMRDISERKKQSDALVRSENRLRATVDTALDCIIGMDESGNIIEFNPAAEACFGYIREEVIGHKLSDKIIPPQFRDSHQQGLQHYAKKGAGGYIGKRVQVRAMRADGSEFPAELAISVAEGLQANLFIGYLRDITQRVQAEEDRTRLESQLRQAQKMEAIGHLTGGIAHDFNNLLTGIMGYIVMAQEWEEKNSDDKLQRYLQRAQKSGQRARDLIQQMLTFSRGQKGEPRPLSLVPYIKESIKLLEASIPSSIEIHFEYEENLPRVMFDPVHLGQVLMNLCLNARDAIESTGHLTIRLQTMHCEADCICSACHQPLSGDYINLSVKDDGQGISSQDAERIFEPFYTTKEIGKGSGMGLATVHGIVHEHHGHVVLESQPGAGATFHILLPEAKAIVGNEVADTTHVTASHPQGLSGQIMLVDDDAAVNEYMQDRLSDWGLHVTACRNGYEALATHDDRTRPFDLYIIDYTMPGITGLALARELRQKFSEVKIILYTGYSEDLDEQDVLRKDVQSLLRKPLDENQLFNQIKQLLDS